MVGKTTLASQFGKTLLCAFEQGSNALNNVYVQPMKTWQDWKSTVAQLVKKKNELQEKFEIIVIDTVDEAFKLCEKYTCQQAGAETIKEVAAYGGGYKINDDNFMTPFRDLAFAGYGLIFISHDIDKTLTDDNGQEYNKIIPALPSRPFNLINKMVDIVAYIRQISTTNEDGISSKRYMFFRSDNRFLTKSRFKYIVPKIELNYEQFVNAIYDAIDEEVKHTGGEATNEVTITERTFDELMEEAKDLWIKASGSDKICDVQEILDKEFGKPTKFSEIMPGQKQQLLNVLMSIKEII